MLYCICSYPFTISKNHMLNVGSPHSWPILLGALTWLIEVSDKYLDWKVVAILVAYSIAGL